MPEKKTERIEDKNLVSEIEGWYEVVTKDNDGEAHVHRLYKHSTKTRPGFEEIDFINQAPSKIIRPTRRSKARRADELTLFIPDMQIGYRNGESFHDETAMELGQIAIRETQPDRVVFLGDNLDLAPMSKFEQRPDWQNTTQQSIDRFSEYLAQTRANAPDAEIVVLEGNHEARFERNIREHNAELMGIRRANASKELGVLTLRFLLQADEMEIDYITGYPNGQYWLEDNLKARHGRMVRSGGSTASGMVRKEDSSTVFGHIHRHELQYRTIPTRSGNKQIYAVSFGTMAKIDGSIPSKDLTTDEYNRVVPKAENWQQGLGLIYHNDRLSQPMPVHILDGQMMIEGKSYGIE